MSFQPAFNARLIAEVKKYPCLYNHAKRGSGDTMERMRIWDNIASAVDRNCSGDFAKKRWLQLRDRYRKELKTAIKQNFAQPVRWCYFSHLSWLDPYLKDNLALASCDNMNDTAMESLAGCFEGFQGLPPVKTEADDGISVDEDRGVRYPFFDVSTLLDRVLAASNRQSVSPGLDNDDSGPQSVDTSNGAVDEERAEASGTDCAGSLPEMKEVKPNVSQNLVNVLSQAAAVAAANNSSGTCSPSNSIPKQIPGSERPETPVEGFSIKDHYFARQMQQQQQFAKQFWAMNKSAFDWISDEDMLYSRIIGLRLKKMEPKKRKRVREQILSMLEAESDGDDDDESSSSKSAKLQCDSFVSMVTTVSPHPSSASGSSPLPDDHAHGAKLTI